ncbi:MAG: hypothetical protein VCB79_04590, partial [Dehalococcoidia bacterium]
HRSIPRQRDTRDARNRCHAANRVGVAAGDGVGVGVGCAAVVAAMAAVIVPTRSDVGAAVGYIVAGDI